ncbi:hypothetical protein BJ322DRAFT_1015308 [Thelephora terrestris]|uniref:Transmembrane protein n=1 Tax=Thelephora terrestris TaxID=56493 RepID=A0A9P6H350_9AGAM|nr:hypothetical protein BJ322DRAFT_1015308 [Thelephora terrestris]
MSSVSPTAFLLWSILAIIFLIFLAQHLWNYDRFNCLKWNSGRQPGAFKRVMTYSYLASVPLLVVFSTSMTAVKVREGAKRRILSMFPTVMPMPVQLYSESSRTLLLPLYFVFATSWALELLRGLTCLPVELTFWLFMLNQSPGKCQWFSSFEYKVWFFGTFISILGLPLTALVARNDLVLCDAWIVVVGSSASLATTIAFVHVLVKFPGFLRHIKSEGAEAAIVVQLHTFYRLNIARFIFRALFCVSLLILGVDAVAPGGQTINHHPYITLLLVLKHDPSLHNSDFLFMLGGIGCFFSSAITLLIFFPRSTTAEMGYQVKPQSPIPNSRPPSSYTSTEPTSPKSPVNFVQYHQRYLEQYPPIDIDYRFPPRRSPSRTRRGRAARSLDFEVGLREDSASTSSKAPSYHQYPEEELWESQSRGRRREREYPKADVEAALGTTDEDAPQLPTAALEARSRRGEVADTAPRPTTNLHPYVCALPPTRGPSNSLL